MATGNFVDVTDQVEVGSIDDEFMEVRRCVCGAQFGYWDFSIGRDSDPNYLTECKFCGRQFYFRYTVQVFQLDVTHVLVS